MSTIRPILFNTEMVRAILEGRKTVTRRVVKPQPEMALAYIWGGYKARHWSYSPYDEDNFSRYRDNPKYWTPPCNADDILYVRETWSKLHNRQNPDGRYVYQASDSYPFGEDGYIAKFRWHPSIHMPKEAARIWLRVTNVRVERLQEIDEDGAISEGLYPGWLYHGTGSAALSARSAFLTLWNFQTPASKPEKMWAANPWVWVIVFERCEKPEETL